MGCQQLTEAAQQFWMARAGPLQIRLACLGRGQLQGGQENGSFVALFAVSHPPTPMIPCMLPANQVGPRRHAKRQCEIADFRTSHISRSGIPFFFTASGGSRRAAEKKGPGS